MPALLRALPFPSLQLFLLVSFLPLTATAIDAYRTATAIDAYRTAMRHCPCYGGSATSTPFSALFKVNLMKMIEIEYAVVP